MAVKQTAGRTQLGEFAPKFAELNDDVLFGEVWQVKKQGCRIDLCVYAPIFDGQGDFFEIICFNIQP